MSRPKSHKLIDTSGSSCPVLYETHSHTVLCHHAIGAAEAYCERAVRSGLSGLIFTDHNPMPNDYLHQERLQESTFPEYLSLVGRMREIFKESLDVRLGIECDYLPEYREHLEKQLANTKFDYVIGSVHCQFPEFMQYASTDDSVRFEEVYFDFLAESAETGLFDSVAHPHLAAAILGIERPTNPKVLDKFLNRLEKTGVAIELNTGGVTYWDRNLYLGAASRGIPVIIGGDAHAPVHVASYFTIALRFLKDVGYEKCTVILGASKIETLVDEALDYMEITGEPEV